MDLKSDLVLAAEVLPADHADTQTMVDSVMQAQVNLQKAGSEQEIEEAAADKGYHAAATLELCDELGVRTYIPEKKRTHDWVWTNAIGCGMVMIALNAIKKGRTVIYLPLHVQSSHRTKMRSARLGRHGGW